MVEDIWPTGGLSLTPPDPEGYDGNYLLDPAEINQQKK